MRVWGLLLAAMVALWTGFVAAQQLAEDLSGESDRGFVAGLLEGALGGEGRTVRVEGFEGALSSTAQIARITIADDQGVWLELREIEMVWTRSALLRGRIEIDALTVAEAILSRPPQAPPSDMPSPEAQGFSLPNLPVSVEIERVEIGRIALGAPILGAEAEMTLAASARLADGSGAAQIDARRIDGQAGNFALNASFDAGSEAVVIDLQLDEAADGLVARSLNLPGRPSVRLAVQGEGPLDDLQTEIALDTNDEPRLRGAVTLTGRGDGGRSFEADLSGNLAPLFPSAYQPFFGDTVALAAEGAQDGAGALTLDALRFETGATELDGALALSPDYWPTRFDMQGRIGAPNGGPLLLPFGESPIRIEAARLSVAHDNAQSEAWTAEVTVDQLDTAAVVAGEVQITAEGTLDDISAPQSGVTGAVQLAASDVAFEDAAVQSAVGAQVQGRFDVAYREGAPVQITGLELSGDQYGLTGEVLVAGLDAEFETRFDTTLQARDLARFAPLAGVDLRGAAEAQLDGRVDAGGAFEIAVKAATRELGVGIAQADAVLAGQTTLVMDAVRDAAGTRVPRLDITNRQLALTATADIVTDATTAEFDLRLPDASVIDPQLEGTVRLTGGASQAPEGWSIRADGTGPFDATVEVDGRVTGAEPAVDFSARLPDIAPLAPGYTGAASVSGRATQNDAGWSVDTQITGPYGLNGEVAGQVTGLNTPDIRYALRLPNVRPLVSSVNGAATVEGTAQAQGEAIVVNASLSGPYGSSARVSGPVTGPAPQVEFSASVPDVGPFGVPLRGALDVDGRAVQQGASWRIDTRMRGLGGTDASVSGTVGGGAMALSANGSAPLALAGPFIAPRSLAGQAQFDLRLDGAPGLQGLSGTVTTQGARLSAPTFAVALEGIDARIGLSGGQAQLDISGAVSTGGQITLRGPVDLTGGMRAALTARLEAVRLVDPTLYETVLQGQVRVEGPLSGGAQISGQIGVGETNIVVPSASTSGFAIVPEIIHQGAPPAVRQTIARAGLDGNGEDAGEGGAGPDYGLNIVINAPSRIFVRGRGLDAEMGGRLTLRGTTNNLISAGRFSLVRGRLDVLGKRFVLDEGSVDLQGQLDPFLRFAATTNTSVGTATVLIEGPASEPRVRFVSSPEAPQDEVLAQIFFGREASQLSAFQALQLASAVATLAGEGGEGVISKLRRGFNLDDLDVTTDAEGNTGLRVGKYLSDNVYSQVTVGDTNTAGVSLNIDLAPNLTASGRVKSDGDTSIGIYFGKDY
ncbi:autotransporter secretion inner membrane protein TamB [Litoreibacter ponti]|uniref:Autotransporter secretion inner membrane protein TamB n=1 Tax=Litoreibacter ponti TaxID=1510457 RepID=A0A2T6BJB6_9RHOB|nr:translocation/assembly module TamB domain-containing protein [Litoreibacter ponti]PTX56145.1 autotransporter secretion inner membrane protein TamB [Litoreibacter ponti]